MTRWLSRGKGAGRRGRKTQTKIKLLEEKKEERKI
jgi:hypothetical protein